MEQNLRSVMTGGRKLAGAFIACAVLLTGCGGGGGDDNSDVPGSRVVNMSSDTNPLGVGQGAVVSVNFSFSANDVFDDGVHVIVVVGVPAAVRFRAGTAEVDQPTGEDRSVGAQVLDCGPGGQFLAFDLNSTDLQAAENPSGDADARLTFTVDGVSAAANTTLTAIAHDNALAFDCNGFAPDAVLSLTVQ